MTYIFLSITALFIVLHIIFSKKVRTKDKIIEIILFYLLVIYIGCMGIFAAIGHTFYADQIAQMIGWQTGSPFQFEVAMANLAIGVLGIMCIWQRGNFWLAAVLGGGIFLFGDGVGHVYQMVYYNNTAEYNSGAILYFDLIIPVLLLILYFVNKKNQLQK